jgi:hypothetical protein
MLAQIVEDFPTIPRSHERGHIEADITRAAHSEQLHMVSALT